MSGCSKATCCPQDHVDAVVHPPPTPTDQRPCRTWGIVHTAGMRPQAGASELGGRPRLPPPSSVADSGPWARRQACVDRTSCQWPVLSPPCPPCFLEMPPASVSGRTHQPVPSPLCWGLHSPRTSRPVPASAWVGVFNPSSCASVSVVT